MQFPLRIDPLRKCLRHKILFIGCILVFHYAFSILYFHRQTTRNYYVRLAISSSLPTNVDHEWRFSLQEPQSHTVNTTKFAYAFVIGGCNPEKPNYRFYIYNILVATQILRRKGSTSDVVAFVQVSWESNATRIPEERLLRALNVRVMYIPKSRHESFYRTNLDKFRILGLTEYERVLFLDGDVMPTANLDYLFEMSINGTFHENVVLQGKNEPANGGFFMLKPGGLHEIQTIIEKCEERTRAHQEFDIVQGWGSPILPPDNWEGYKSLGYNWTFIAAFADQGLLYYWVKYLKARVTIVQIRGKIEHWSRDTNGRMQRRVVRNPLPPLKPEISLDAFHTPRNPPFGQFVHFTSKSKPWFAQNKNMSSGTRYWMDNLIELAQYHDINIGQTIVPARENWPLLGLYPKKRDLVTSSTNLLESVYL